MRSTKNWGFVNSGAQLYMLNYAERHRKLKQKKKPAKHSSAKIIRK